MGAQGLEGLFCSRLTLGAGGGSKPEPHPRCTLRQLAPSPTGLRSGAAPPGIPFCLHWARSGLRGPCRIQGPLVGTRRKDVWQRAPHSCLLPAPLVTSLSHPNVTRSKPGAPGPRRVDGRQALGCRPLPGPQGKWRCVFRPGAFAVFLQARCSDVRGVLLWTAGVGGGGGCKVLKGSPGPQDGPGSAAP